MKNKNYQKGFTLIELLVVIAIIGLLASVVLVALNSARQKSRVAKRVADLKQIATALELYYGNNNAYPIASTNWNSVCSSWNVTTANNTIPGMVPTYMSSIPVDPSSSGVANNCYLYISTANGSDYKFLDYSIVDMTDAQVQASGFVDPARNYVASPLRNNPCGSTDASLSMAVYSPGYRCQ